jgi:hypothetical protein
MKTKDLNKSQTMTFVKKASEAIAIATTSKLLAQPEMRKVSIANKERYLNWEKKKAQKVMNDLIYAYAEPLTEELIDIAIIERNPNAINSLLDRGFGKANQNVNHGGQPNNPIVFLPSVLMDKYRIQEGVYKPIEEDDNS